MKKYETYQIIKKKDIQDFNGLGRELITHFHNPQGKIFPLNINCFGITYPTPDYYIKRFPVRGFILEYVVSGKGYVEIDGKKNTVDAGDVYLLKPGENCEYYADKKDPYQKMWVNFGGEFASRTVALYQLKNNIFKGVSLEKLFEKLFELDKISTDFAVIRFEATSIITEMLMTLAKSVEKEEYLPEVVVSIKNELSAFINKPYRLDELSGKFFLSKSQIIRDFKKAYGTTPYKFLLDLKINYAKTMLENSNASVKEISEHLGFSSPYHFSETFKNRVGVSPSAYRKK